MKNTLKAEQRSEDQGCAKPSVFNIFTLQVWAQSDSESLTFAIYFVQRLSAALAPNFKMAANI